MRKCRFFYAMSTERGRGGGPQRGHGEYIYISGVVGYRNADYYLDVWDVTWRNGRLGGTLGTSPCRKYTRVIWEGKAPKKQNGGGKGWDPVIPPKEDRIPFSRGGWRKGIESALQGSRKKSAQKEGGRRLPDRGGSTGKKREASVRQKEIKRL